MPASYKKAFLIFVVFLAVVCAAIYMFIHRNEEYTDDAAIDSHIITISPKVGGYVKAVYINDNQRVKAGDVLVEIDPADYIFRRDRALAGLAAAKASHSASNRTLETTRVSAPSNLEAAEAQVASATANWIKAAKDLKRMQVLGDEARSREQLDSAIAEEKTAFSSLQDAKAKLRSAKTAPQVIESAKSSAEMLAAQIKQAQADLDQAEKDLADTRLVAPIDGRITKRGVEPGDFVQSGQQLTYLVGNDIWVVADFKETQLQHMHMGDKAEIYIDAFPNAKIEGKLDSIQPGTGVRFSAFPPENATGNFIKIVQRVPVKIVLTQQPDPSLAIGPGMSVEPTVYTK